MSPYARSAWRSKSQKYSHSTTLGTWRVTHSEEPSRTTKAECQARTPTDCVPPVGSSRWSSAEGCTCNENVVAPRSDMESCCPDNPYFGRWRFASNHTEHVLPGR